MSHSVFGVAIAFVTYAVVSQRLSTSVNAGPIE